MRERNTYSHTEYLRDMNRQSPETLERIVADTSVDLPEGFFVPILVIHERIRAGRTLTVFEKGKIPITHIRPGSNTPEIDEVNTGIIYSIGSDQENGSLDDAYFYDTDEDVIAFFTEEYDPKHTHNVTWNNILKLDRLEDLEKRQLKIRHHQAPQEYFKACHPMIVNHAMIDAQRKAEGTLY